MEYKEVYQREWPPLAKEEKQILWIRGFIEAHKKVISHEITSSKSNSLTLRPKYSENQPLGKQERISLYLWLQTVKVTIYNVVLVYSSNYYSSIQTSHSQ